MSTLDTLPTDEQARVEAAAEWRQRLKQDPVLELSPDYLAWISDPANARVLRAMEDALAAFDDAASAPEILDMRQAALARARQGRTRRPLSRRALARIAAAAVLVLGAGSVALYAWLQAPTAYSTGVGGRQMLALADGSRISLDSDSRVSVRYTESARTIMLDRGRARFDVAHDVTRPFTVTAGAETVVAVGTSFDVERLGPKVLVTLIQGRVVIKNAAPAATAPRPAVSLNAGQELVAANTAKPAVIIPANLQVATAWEAGRLVFQHETLAEAVTRVNRYTDRPIAVDPSVASIRINGVFNAGDVGSFVSAVTSYFPIQATTDADNTIVLERRS